MIFDDMKRITGLQAFYLITAIIGAIVPWYYNLSHVADTGEVFTLAEYFRHGFLTPLTSSITTDFFIGTTPVLVWMIIEGRRLQIKRMWLIVICTFLIAFAFTCPLFLYLRNRKLALIPAA